MSNLEALLSERLITEPTAADRIADHRYQMEFAHRSPRVFLLFHPVRSAFHPVHSDVTMCRVLMAAGHGVTDIDALLAAAR